MRRKLVYYALWPVQCAILAVAWLFRFLFMLFIVSNPVTLALWLSRPKRRTRRKERS